jgi:hypothetical protein
LPNERKVEVIIELGSDPDSSGFNPAMPRGLSIYEVEVLSISEEELDVRKQPALVSLDGEVLVGPFVGSGKLQMLARSLSRISCNSLI